MGDEKEETEKEREKEREKRLRGGGWPYMHTRTFRCQSSLEIFGLWGAKAPNTIFPLKIYVFIHAKTARMKARWLAGADYEWEVCLLFQLS